MVIINLTPHLVRVEDSTGIIVNFARSGMVARVSMKRQKVGEIDMIPLYRAKRGSVVVARSHDKHGNHVSLENFPEPQADTYYIVSGMVAMAMPERRDLLVPGQIMRDNLGMPVCCQGFSVETENGKNNKKNNENQENR